MKLKKNPCRWFAILLILPVALIFFNSAITVVPGSAAEYSQHWIKFVCPVMFIPALMWANQLLRKRTLLLGLGLCFLSVYYPFNIDDYEPTRPLKTIHNSKKRQHYIDSGKWFPCCILHDVHYFEYMFNGVIYRRKPQDAFRINEFLKQDQIFVNKSNPQKFLVQKKRYILAFQRTFFVFGISLFLFMPINFVIKKGCGLLAQEKT